MSTIRQKKLANEIVNSMVGEAKTMGEMLENVGYSKSVAEHKPKEIFEGKGVREELEALGWSSDNAKKKVGQILNKDYAEDRDVINAAKLLFQVEGDMAPEKHLVITKKIVSIDE